MNLSIAKQCGNKSIKRLLMKSTRYAMKDLIKKFFCMIVQFSIVSIAIKKKTDLQQKFLRDKTNKKNVGLGKNIWYFLMLPITRDPSLGTSHVYVTRTALSIHSSFRKDGMRRNKSWMNDGLKRKTTLN